MLKWLSKLHKKILLVCFLLSLLTACTLSMDKKEIQKNIHSTPAMDSSVQKYLHSSAALQSGAWSQEQWWEVFDLPQLNQLIVTGLNVNPNLKTFRSRFYSAIEESQISRAALSPWVAFNAKTNEQYRSRNGLYRALNPNIPLDGHEVDFNFSFQYEFDFWAQNYNRFQETIGYAKAREAELAYTGLLTAVSISEGFLKYQATISKLNAYWRLQTILQEEEKLKTLLLKKNIDSEFPVLNTQLQTESVQQIIASLQAERSQYQHFINQMLAREPEYPIKTTSYFKPLSKRQNVPKQIQLDLVSRRPELMARIWEVQAHAYRVGAAMADYYPNVNLIGLVGLESVAWQKLLRASSTTALLRPAIHLPIFTAGAIKANIQKTRAQFNEAVSEYNSALFAAVSEVMDSLALMRSAHKNYQLAQEKLAAARKQLSLSQQREKAGIDNQLQIYFFEKIVIENKIQDIDKNLAQYIAAVRLIQSLGGGYCNKDIPIQKDK